MEVYCEIFQASETQIVSESGTWHLFPWLHALCQLLLFLQLRCNTTIPAPFQSSSCAECGYLQFLPPVLSWPLCVHHAAHSGLPLWCLFCSSVSRTANEGGFSGDHMNGVIGKEAPDQSWPILLHESGQVTFPSSPHPCVSTQDMMSPTPCDALLTMSTVIPVGISVSTVQMKHFPLSSPLLFISSSKCPTLGNPAPMALLLSLVLP